MDPRTRSLIRVTLPEEYQQQRGVRDLVDRLMGRNPEHRFAFIQSHASELSEEEIDA
jgi:topoisomerase-4 subunit B